ncbi:MAG: MBL fold metallo-hydrolase [Gammaproteobacteria bacterium]|nr:MBL fold metallo-hydrolase [Gammaproteobacteria bacterium]
MQITFLGAVRTVTGSKYLINVGPKKILVDCGLYQGYKELRLRNWNMPPVHPSEIEAIILTHAHIDHSGFIPVFIKKGFKGKVYCSHGTKELCAILLPDSGHLQEEDAKNANQYGYSKHKPALPLYTREDGINALEQFVALDFNQPLILFNEMEVKLFSAGHIIGASLAQLTYKKTTLLFTGDLGRPHHPVMRAPTQITETDYLVVESTYGDRLHDKSDPLDKLADVINDTVANKGSVVIPAFAVGRTQDLLYQLYQLKESKRIPNVPIYLDSPMAQNVSDLLKHYSSEHRIPEELCDKVCQIATYTRTQEESQAIDASNESAIIISASGMTEGGRVLHHLKKYLPGASNTVLFTGFQAPGTRGDRIINGESHVKIHGEMIPVKARIAVLENMSAHADYQEIIEWLKNFKKAPIKTFITHGELTSSTALKNEITEQLHWPCVVPDYLQTETLA